MNLGIITSRSNHVFENYVRTAGLKLIHVTAELVKCCTVYYFLELSVLNLFYNTKKVKIAYTLIRTSIVFVPLKEEFLFRGVIEQGIGLIQRVWTYRTKNLTLMKNNSRNQKILRVVAAALMFSLSHIYKTTATSGQKGVILAQTFIAGLNYGFVSEKYKTLSIPILAHGINNLVVFLVVDKISLSSGYLLIAINQLAILALNLV